MVAQDFVQWQILSLRLGTTQTIDNCSDFSETGYSCVPYYNCENGTILTDGGDIIGIRSTDEDGRAVLNPEDSICPGLLEVCCRSEDFFNQPVTKNGDNQVNEFPTNSLSVS